MKRYQTVDETLAYNTSENSTNTDERHLVAGSRNVLIDETRKVKTRSGNSIFGGGNNTLQPVQGGPTWYNSTGGELPLRVINGVLYVYFDSAYRAVFSALSTTAKVRFAPWYDDGEAQDVLLFVDGTDNIYEWSGAVVVVDSVTASTITKTGTTTWAESRAYTTGNKVFVNVRTSTEYTYTGGEATTTLTGTSTTADIIAGDILVQKVVTNTDKPAAGRTNNTIWVYDNQLCLASDSDEQVYVSKNNDYATYTFSSPRVAGEGALLTLDNPAKGFGELENSLIIFAGRSSIYQVTPKDITVGTTLAETFEVEKYQTGFGQSAQNQEVIQQIGSTLVFLTHEPAVRELPSPSALQGGEQVKTLSNPIKPDMDAEDWTEAAAFWYKNGYYLSAPANGRVYILQYREDADGRLRRFWQPPQTMFIAEFTVINDALYGHSSVVSETYKLFDTDAYSDFLSDGTKLPIRCVAKFAYRNYKDRVNDKNFDEYFVEGEIGGSTQVLLTLYYNFGGTTQRIERTINGNDQDILLETLLNTSLAQQPLGQQPLGGSNDEPADAAKFRVIFEQAKEDFVEMQDVYETDDVDKYWSIISRGANAQVSRRRNVGIMK
jgi:hypothetical protein